MAEFLRSVCGGRTQHVPLFPCQTLPNGARNGVDFAAVIGVPATNITDGGEGAGCVGDVGRSAVQCGGVANEQISDFEWNGAHLNGSGFDGSQRILARHTVRAGGNFDGAMIGCDPNQAEADKKM